MDQNLDVLNMQFTPEEVKPKEEEEEEEVEDVKETSEEDNYMELHVEKELKDKIEPLIKQLAEHKEGHEQLFLRVNELETMIQRVDRHYNGVSRALLTK